MTYAEAVAEMDRAESEDLRQYWSQVVDSIAWMLDRFHLSNKQA